MSRLVREDRAMSRRRNLKEVSITHPQTQRTMRVLCMEGGGFDVIIVNPERGVKRMAWAVGGLFTGGKTGTRMRLFERDGLVDDVEDSDE